MDPVKPAPFRLAGRSRLFRRNELAFEENQEEPMGGSNKVISVENNVPAKSPVEPIKDAKEDIGGLRFSRLFTKEGVSPYDAIEWETRNASISNEKGEIIFEQKEVEVPKSWSQTATNIVVSK